MAANYPNALPALVDCGKHDVFFVRFGAAEFRNDVTLACDQHAIGKRQDLRQVRRPVFYELKAAQIAT